MMENITLRVNDIPSATRKLSVCNPDEDTVTSTQQDLQDPKQNKSETSLSEKAMSSRPNDEVVGHLSEKYPEVAAELGNAESWGSVRQILRQYWTERNIVDHLSNSRKVDMAEPLAEIARFPMKIGARHLSSWRRESKRSAETGSSQGMVEEKRNAHSAASSSAAPTGELRKDPSPTTKSNTDVDCAQTKSGDPAADKEPAVLVPLTANVSGDTSSSAILSRDHPDCTAPAKENSIQRLQTVGLKLRDALVDLYELTKAWSPDSPHASKLLVADLHHQDKPSRGYKGEVADCIQKALASYRKWEKEVEELRRKNPFPRTRWKDFDAQMAMTGEIDFTQMKEQLERFMQGPKNGGDAPREDNSAIVEAKSKLRCDSLGETDWNSTQKDRKTSLQSFNPLGTSHPLNTTLPRSVVNFSRPIKVIPDSSYPAVPMKMQGTHTRSDLPDDWTNPQNLPGQKEDPEPVNCEDKEQLNMSFWPAKPVGPISSGTSRGKDGHGPRSLSLGGQLTPKKDAKSNLSSLPTRSRTLPSPSTPKETIRAVSGSRSLTSSKAQAVKSQAEGLPFPTSILKTAKETRQPLQTLAQPSLRPPWTYVDSPPRKQSQANGCKSQASLRIPNKTSPVRDEGAQLESGFSPPTSPTKDHPRVQWDTFPNIKSKSMPSFSRVQTSSNSKLPRLVATPSSSSSGSTEPLRRPRPPQYYTNSKLPRSSRSLPLSTQFLISRLAVMKNDSMKNESMVDFRFRERPESSVYYSAEEDISDAEVEMF